MEENEGLLTWSFSGNSFSHDQSSPPSLYESGSEWKRWDHNWMNSDGKFLNLLEKWASEHWIRKRFMLDPLLPHEVCSVDSDPGINRQKMLTELCNSQSPRYPLGIWSKVGLQDEVSVMDGSVSCQKTRLDNWKDDIISRIADFWISVGHKDT